MSAEFNVEGTFVILRNVERSHIRNGNVPKEVEHSLTALCRYFSSTEEAIREEIVKHVTARVSFLFLIHAENMAFNSVRMRNVDLIEIGLMALVIENSVFDWRETLIRVAMLYRSAQLLGEDGDELIKKAARCASAGMAQRLRAFSDLEPSKKGQEAFWFKDGTNAAGELIYEAVRPESVLKGRKELLALDQRK